MNKNTAFSIAKKFIDFYFPECHSALVTGSSIDGNWNNESDIDIIVISQLENEWFIECFEFEKLMFQAIVLPINKVKQTIIDDYYKREGVFIGMMSKGVILKDNNFYIKKLIEEVQFLKFKGAPEHPATHIKWLHIKVSSLVADLKGNKNFDECFFIMNDITRLLTDLNLSYHRMWNKGIGKILARYLKEVDRELLASLVKGHQEFIKTKEPSFMIEVVEENLKKFGGPLNYYSTSHMVNEVKKNRCILKFGEINNFDLFFNKVLIPFNKFLSEIIGETGSFYCLKHRERNQQADSFYIVLNQNRTVINDYLVPKINMYYSNKGEALKDLNVQLNYPIDIPIEYGFGNGESVILAERLLGELSKNTIGKIDIADFYYYAIHLLLEAGKILFSKDGNYNLFLEVLYDQWVSESLNKEHITTNEQYKESKAVLENDFRKVYKKIFVNLSNFNQNDNLIKNIAFSNLTSLFSKIHKNIVSIQQNNELHVFSFLTQQIRVDISEDDKQIWVYYINLFERIAECFFIGSEDRGEFAYTLLKKASNDNEHVEN